MGSKDTARAKLAKDYSIIGEGVPMMSASGNEIDINDVVYSYTLSVHCDDYMTRREKENFLIEMEVTPWRVIQINYKERYYRVRGVDGCEKTVDHNEGCPTLHLYHGFEYMKKCAREKLLKERKLTEQKIALRNDLIKGIDSYCADLNKMDEPEAPPAAGVVDAA